MITIAFYSYKGGVGRSLALANLGVYMAQFGATVVMVDFDLEAPGLHYKIQPGARIGVGRGVAGILAEASTGTRAAAIDYDVAIDITENVEPSPINEQEDIQQPFGRLLLVPAGDSLQADYWADIARIDWQELFASSRRPGVAALSLLRDHIIRSYNPDIMLIDSRTGITPSAGVATTLLPDVVITFLLNTAEHLDGTKMVIESMFEGRSATTPSEVIPVLSQYTDESLSDRFLQDEATARSLGAVRHMIAQRSVVSAPPLHEVWTALTDGLSAEVASRIAEPFVLHTDLSLQQREQLAFGPHASVSSSWGQPAALLDDYLRLFSKLVPGEMITRYLTGIRNKVRGIIIDRPDDAVRTLENLTALVGDEEIFIDLVKVHALRRDTQSMISAANRLYEVHGSIVVQPAISSALRERSVARGRPSTEPSSVSPDFLEAYWRRAAPNDVEWGAHVARELLERGLVARGNVLIDEDLMTATQPSDLAQVVSALASGSAESEKAAVRVSVSRFRDGENSTEFVRAASTACRYQPNAELAAMLVGSREFSSVAPATAVEVLVAAGRYDEAGAVLVEALATADLGNPIVERLSASWISLSARNRDLKSELQMRNPRIMEFLDSMRDETLRSSRKANRPYR